MSKAPILEIDPCIFIQPKKKPKRTSMVNKVYEDNLPAVRKIIEEDNRKNLRDYESVKDIIVGGKHEVK